jgi:multiple sugar transport system substrate-binding protein
MKPRLSRREFLQRLGLGAAGALLTACGGQPSAQPGATAAAAAQPSAAAPGAAQQKQVVRFTMFGHPQLAEQMVAKFNQTHPDIEVQFERSEGQGYAEKLSAAIAGGNAWDCFRAPSTFPSRFGPKGVIVDLAPFINNDKQYPADLYIEGALDVWNVDGKRYGLPVWALTMWLYYNKKLLDEAGVPYPTPQTTWEEYVEMTKKLTKSDSNGTITQYGANGWGGWTLPVAQDVWSAGGCFYYNENKTAICVNDAKTVNVLQDEADLFHVHKVHPSPLNPPTSPVSLLSGKVATELNGDWMVWDNHEQWKQEFDATLTPLRDGKRMNCYQPDAFVINSTSKVQEAAYKWISWWAADPDSWAIQGRVVFPLTKRQYEDPKLRETWLLEPRPPHMIELALESAKNARLWPVEGHASEFESTIYYPEIDKLWRNQAKAKDVCDTITTKGNQLMSKPVE